MVLKVIGITEDPNNSAFNWVTARGNEGQLVVKVPVAQAQGIGTMLNVTIVVAAPEAITPEVVTPNAGEEVEATEST